MKMDDANDIETPSAGEPLETDPSRVAVVAFAARVPGAQDPVPLEDDTEVRAGLRLDLDAFDPEPFGLTSEEANRLAPAQRILLEIGLEVLELSGRPAGGKNHSRTGLFVSLGDEAHPTVNRVASLLGLDGPAVRLDPESSSSLLAVDLAYRSIVSGDCRACVVGGINLLSSPNSLGQATTPREETNPRGEIAIAILLKSGAEALADGNEILGWIRSSATVQSPPESKDVDPAGSSTRKEVIGLAFRRATLKRKAVKKAVEIDATPPSPGRSGTRIDPQSANDPEPSTEEKSLTERYGDLSGALGITTLLRTILASRRSRRTKFTAIGSFPAGESNTCILVESAPSVSGSRNPSPERSHPCLLTLSTEGPEALDALALRYLEWLAGPDSIELADLCFSTNVGRLPRPHRLALVVDALDRVADKLNLWRLEREPNPRLWAGSLLFFSHEENDSPTLRKTRERWLRSRLEALAPQHRRFLSRCTEKNGWWSEILDEASKADGSSAKLGEGSEVENKDSLAILAQLYVWGANLNWDLFYEGRSRRRIPLPTYPLQKRSIRPLPIEPEGKLNGKIPGPASPKTQNPKETRDAASPKTPVDRSIAVIGMTGRFPGARNLEEFWRNIREGVDAVTEVPKHRWDSEVYFNPDRSAAGSTYSKWGGFLTGTELFDPLLFRISNREAKWMDPQQRFLLETTWECLESAGYAGDALAGTRTGVFVGASYTHLRDDLCRRGADLFDAHGILGSQNAILSNRVSTFFDLYGPSLTVDTLCSSSFVALHLASESLRRGECETALVAGVHVGMSAPYYVALSRVQAISPRGRCRTFDRSADGYVPGEGVGVILLKPLARALEDRDQIHGVIRGIAVNHDGQGLGLTIPNPESQARVIRSALDDASLNPSDLEYVETHGTGTSLGDPIEIAGLTQALSDPRSPATNQSCGIGSVKTNIGHLEPASGIAGLLKVLLAMKAREMPPSLGLEEPNPRIEFEETPFYVLDRPRPWSSKGKRRAGVSSFGLGGVNAHVVVEEAAPIPLERAEIDRPSQILALSGRNREGLVRWIEALRLHLKEDDQATEIRDLCFTANTGRAHLNHRVAILLQTREDLEASLRSLVVDPGLEGDRTQGVFSKPKPREARSDEVSKIRDSIGELSSPSRARLLGWLSGRLITEEILPHFQDENPERSGHVDLQRGEALNDEQWRTLLPLVARLYVLGAQIDFRGMDEGLVRRRVLLPTYPFERNRFTPDIESLVAREPGASPGVEGGSPHPLLQRAMKTNRNGDVRFSLEISLED